MKFAPMLAVILMAGSFGTAGIAYAAPAITPLQQAELNRLSPAVRDKVEARMKDGGQTVQGVLETMLLNNVSQDFAANKVVATDMDRGAVVVTGKDGQLQVFPFDVETLAVRK